MNWYKKQIKKSWNTWEPIMDTYSERGPFNKDNKRRPYPESESSMTQSNPFFGGEVRDGRDHLNDNSNFNNDLIDKEKTTLPGEETLMDKGREREGLSGEEFKANGDWSGHYREEDARQLNDNSRRIDKGEIGPHNMQNRGIYNRFKRKIKIPTFNTL